MANRCLPGAATPSGPGASELVTQKGRGAPGRPRRERSVVQTCAPRGPGGAVNRNRGRADHRVSPLCLRRRPTGPLQPRGHQRTLQHRRGQQEHGQRAAPQRQRHPARADRSPQGTRTCTRQLHATQRGHLSVTPGRWVGSVSRQMDEMLARALSDRFLTRDVEKSVVVIGETRTKSMATTFPGGNLSALHVLRPRPAWGPRIAVSCFCPPPRASRVPGFPGSPAGVVLVYPTCFLHCPPPQYE